MNANIDNIIPVNIMSKWTAQEKRLLRRTLVLSEQMSATRYKT